MTRVPFVSFESLIFVGCPVTSAASGLLQGSPPVLLLEVAGMGVKVGMRAASSVGEGTSVSVGVGEGTGVSVGGIGVLVGIAAWVWATMVKAAATAVD